MSSPLIGEIREWRYGLTKNERDLLCGLKAAKTLYDSMVLRVPANTSYPASVLGSDSSDASRRLQEYNRIFGAISRMESSHRGAIHRQGEEVLFRVGRLLECERHGGQAACLKELQESYNVLENLRAEGVGAEGVGDVGL